MKFKKILFALVITSTLAIVSCKETADEINDNFTPSVSATVGTTEWSTNIVAGVTSSTFVISASKSPEAIILTIPVKTVGVYPIDGVNNLAFFAPNTDSLDQAYIAYSGSIEITSINASGNQLDGKFNFTGINTSFDTLSISNGILKNVPVK